ncbi:Methyl-accepting chemotaxis protein mcpB [Actinoplanes sp. SE50]|uniref:methyl-accepting chemotaxis protein n=1 Tax=unclassified Actinoplanes TaxID=2626549 RepID=UPI00023EBCD3|nr:MULTISPECIES: methyl-accepting chemotaxis protein [unclassified Actinoplanes]AEV82348.1 Methyl-accepting chemotaxis protein mcpB [Actinoplanes sp. SE50/110]ATO80745.1 Methyl-accepting chemotaxis protein mcpB [Actinoplanes sp. SE50]SLL98153.1 chemotaxis protein [Actinoplanes sp. SE50/110]
MESVSRRRGVTIVARLVIMGAAGLLSVGLVTAFAVRNASDQTAANEEIATVSEAMSDQWNADMQHDALRADVMSAMYATTASMRETFAVDEVADHGATMLQMYDDATKAAPAALKADYVAIRPSVVAYTEAAKRMVATAETDHPAAAAGLSDFLKVYSDLEEKLGDLDTRMYAEVKAAAARGAESSRSSNRFIVIAALLAALITATACVLTVRAVRRPLRGMLDALRALARRDLTVRAPVVNRDELGAMAVALNEAAGALQETVSATAGRVGVLTQASTELQKLAGTLDRSAEETSAQARSADGSAGNVSGSVSAMMAATEQLSASIREIAKQALSAAATTNEATTSANRTAHAVARLSEASREVGAIVQMITNIAEQTNLLALNASIEAARAGHAGKGFAVVATEVKDLAQETAQATADITAKILAIQEMTTGTAEAIEAIASVITRIDDGQRTIAAAVEQQSSTTDQLARNVGAVSAAASEISGTVSHISTSSAHTAEGANTTRHSAELVSGAAGEIRALIDEFRY